MKNLYYFVIIGQTPVSFAIFNLRSGKREKVHMETLNHFSFKC